MREIWKSVVGYEGYYEVSNTGSVRSIDRIVKTKKAKSGTSFLKGVYLKPSVIKGYPMVVFSVGNKRVGKKIHRLVAEAFIPNPKNKPQVNHKNGQKEDNSVENLEWCTSLENIRHSFEKGLNSGKKGEKHPLSKLKKEDVINIRLLHKHGVLSTMLSEYYNVHQKTIRNIVNKETWTHI